MPKEPKPRKRTQESPIARAHHAPLGQVITDDLRSQKYAPLPRRAKKDDDSVESEDEFMDDRTSQRILKISREQLTEVEGVDDEVSGEEIFNTSIVDDDEIIHDEGYVTVDGPDYSEEQEAMVNAMMGTNKYEERRNLADIILEKIKEKESALSDEQVRGEDEIIKSMELPPKVIKVYTEIGEILSRYTSGKLPKAFKVIPSLSNWEEILYLTQPHTWTPQAMYASTRIFASNLNPKMAQRFYNLVLLDAIRADIHENGKLNYHYYNALIKAAYKPAAFFKGIVLPLGKAEARCTLREAAIIASALRRVSIPVHHSAVAIQKLAAGEYSPASSIFLKEMLNKKYSLPNSVIETLVVNHFGEFRFKQSVDLPVLWHQSLLVFVQRYREPIVKEEKFKEILKDVMKAHSHSKITREIRRELFGSAAWQQERVGEKMDVDM